MSSVTNEGFEMHWRKKKWFVKVQRKNKYAWENLTLLLKIFFVVVVNNTALSE